MRVQVQRKSCHFLSALPFCSYLYNTTKYCSRAYKSTLLLSIWMTRNGSEDGENEDLLFCTRYVLSEKLLEKAPTCSKRSVYATRSVVATALHARALKSRSLVGRLVLIPSSAVCCNMYVPYFWYTTLQSIFFNHFKHIDIVSSAIIRKPRHNSETEAHLIAYSIINGVVGRYHTILVYDSCFPHWCTAPVVLLM